MASQANPENTQVTYGQENAGKAIAQFCADACSSFCCCIDSAEPSLAVSFGPYRQALLGVEGRGIKLRFITEITKDNLQHCKDMLKFAELRHLDGIKGNFAVSDRGYIATARLQQEQPIVQVISSNVAAMMEQNQYLFETLWEKAIPADQKVKEIEQGGRVETTEVLNGIESVFARSAQVTANAKNEIAGVADQTMPSVLMGVEQTRRMLVDAVSRGVKARFVTEITQDNIMHVKELMKLVELRHIGGIRGNFGIYDGKEYMATSVVQEGQPVAQLLYSNVDGMVKQQYFVFDTLWSRALPAEERVKQIEEGVEPYYALTLSDPEEIGKAISKGIKSSTAMMVYSGAAGMQMIRDRFFESYRQLVALPKEGRHGGVRWLVTVSGENKDLVREFIDIGVQVRHTRYQSPLTFALDGRTLYSTVEEGLGGAAISANFFVTNEPAYRRQFAALFDELWDGAVDAMDKIRDIEAGIISETEVVYNPAKIECLYKDMMEKARTEIMLLIQTPAAFARQKKLDLKQILEQASTRRVKVRLLTDGVPEQDLAELEACGVDIQQLSQSPKEASLPKITAVIVDSKASLVIEMRDNSGDSFADAVGSAVLSTSWSVALSYARIFESLWQETQVAAQLKKTDRMQKEFINVAAHELRTPIMPILGVADMIVSDDPDGTEDLTVTREEINIIARNARRLQRLSSDILDVTKIESDNLKLDKTRFALNDLLASSVKDTQSHGQNSNVQFVLELGKNEYVNADRQRISQVVANLLGNAAKFTKAGTVALAAESDGDMVTVTVSDTGAGIDREIIPRLFTKFATKSETGTGLGLYISKRIIEAHGGRIWAENRPGGRGAVFRFTLPV